MMLWPISSNGLEASPGRVDRFTLAPSGLAAQRNIDVWLPEGYDTTRKYAVIYMNDGQMLFDSTTTWNKQEWGADEVAAKLIAENKIRPCIIVGVWNREITGTANTTLKNRSTFLLRTPQGKTDP